MRVMKSRAADVAAQIADANLASFIGSPEKVQKLAKTAKRRKESAAGAKRREVIAQVEQRIKSQDWEGSTAVVLVALYWIGHLKVYGVEPVELDSAAAWVKAAKAAGMLVKRQFDGDVQTGIKFLRWVWMREGEREQWGRRNNISRKRITWVTQFCYTTLVGDWRTEKVRRGA